MVLQFCTWINSCIHGSKQGVTINIETYICNWLNKLIYELQKRIFTQFILVFCAWKFLFWHGKVMEKSWNFFLRFLWEPCWNTATPAVGLIISRVQSSILAISSNLVIVTKLGDPTVSAKTWRHCRPKDRQNFLDCRSCKSVAGLYSSSLWCFYKIQSSATITRATITRMPV